MLFEGIYHIDIISIDVSVSLINMSQVSSVDGKSSARATIAMSLISEGDLADDWNWFTLLDLYQTMRASVYINCTGCQWQLPKQNFKIFLVMPAVNCNRFVKYIYIIMSVIPSSLLLKRALSEVIYLCLYFKNAFLFYDWDERMQVKIT